MIILRGKTWWLRRRVPKQYQGVADSREVWVSLKTDSEKVARRKAEAVWTERVAGWEAAMGGDFERAELRWSRAREAARSMGLQFIPSREVAELPVEDILARAEIAKKGKKEADAALGVAPAPRLKLADALDIYWKVSDDKTVTKTPDQLRRWRNPRIRAMKRLVDVVGDKYLDELSRDDMLDYRAHLVGRVQAGEISASTANKEITHATSVLNRVNEMQRLELSLPTKGLSVKAGKKKTRAPFSVEWIRDKLLAPGALDGLNQQAREIFLMMVNTGARPSEIAGIKVVHLDLDGDIPLVWFAADGRELKNYHSERKVPLAGVSLDAARSALARAKKTGGDLVFPTYFGKDKISDTVNKYLRENRLKEHDGTTFYSLRHAFEDRMIHAGVLDRVRRDIFGHALQEERYGYGGGDEVRYEAVKRVAL
ncbi:tyrosine-type recombinase/integrase [Maritimibacter sp. DP07]|uniref:Tyrosine-type recombinase/integrase n=1 Tax=Maritimibacter harenae TaxID=2606218 RepID=A0A845LXI8_9RHOB|nr:tyrosine-type recombinase/integrase [Maritimibacter harenae]MZR12670.1 tyrosine-type recombinase/integrase [Maritimibacter harenae]